ncbi:hypothetical protein H7J50_07420 [Mycobacterium intermedium]|uniref:hypothetical protein n=1 Tax=Mycobacterium intermedium TaxID=28445 RepID=UPI0012E9A626|nr:hypothetical protein [Mycobacterium intermedium]MCV6963636.1 hypothetical protein [Mycobacterium intermedium]
MGAGSAVNGSRIVATADQLDHREDEGSAVAASGSLGVAAREALPELLAMVRR